MKLRLFTVALIAAISSQAQAVRLAGAPPADGAKEEKAVELSPTGGNHCVNLGDKPIPAGCCDDDRPLADRVQEGIEKQKARCEAVKLWPTGGAAAVAATPKPADASQTEVDGEGDSESEFCGMPAMAIAAPACAPACAPVAVVKPCPCVTNDCCPEDDKPINQRVKESIKFHSQSCCSPWYGAKLEDKDAEKKPDAAAQSENEEGEEKKEEKPKDACNIGEQIQKSLDCQEKKKPLQQKVVESFLRDHRLCGRGLAQTDADNKGEGEGEGEGEFCGYSPCGMGPVAIQHTGCCKQEKDKPLPQRVSESVHWRMNNWCSPWKGEEKKGEEEKKPDATSQIDGEGEGKEGEEKPKCDIGEQVQKAIECRDKNKPLQNKVAESIQWHANECRDCHSCMAQGNAEPEAEEGEEDKKKCDIGEQVQKAIECRDKNKPLQAKVAESIQWHANECRDCHSCM